ncbi:MAG: hypothetical protein A2725_04685 [Candidatus Magasanikbacteria bacterium RIFCSPHIGHO2_01_FULL_33_34]|uniref:Peptidase S11 D-alanyl-D-alanine carboxypeptidase A N-terminal domain-containing protein n=1 Tax=Candidatus Magasanikbacteria bacterium RIFCSPHIGHO2_01_FULL_33_34 TaxID=1798671 RepID=A0A1F6LLK5_9BACT|nr:MAG: hypothetical protein A2725_04685 [Candidatus Magasanikbacteria bacterium RIFCSPHIGHO2_01_FULL_33_34]OGH65973.1 MAG: hypothetical protein A3B83_02505 [Candidatus Magasanikbacteria bacterium RIFCSPHIGHO2_02_FULL_33_17]OGH76368.1 MAG: hypothetical protein A3A89_01045 [Candidatus Magasanikbacteria bacterium RIFCSPLOWO2_01_FULL_33_34]OGH81474.1 MAG: hypothetical protein A3F93_01345 [Candidatus Magasanikbacteria bacterium RIFCSPLOWO2_12_FULL_34_7]
MNTPFFGPEKPVDKIGFFWKFISVLLAVGAVFTVSFFTNKLEFSSELNEISLVMEKMTDLSDSESTLAGGDIVIEPVSIPNPEIPVLVGELLPQDSFGAKSIIVKDHKSGAILYSKNEYDKRSIASITKLMSALVLLEKNPDWNSEATVIGSDSMGTHMYAGDIYTLDELWYSALVGSSNKAILSLANALDWPVVAFVERMNQKARELGMTETTFVEPTGLDEGNKSSASDIVILLNNALENTKIVEALKTPEYNLYSKQREKSHHMWNTDWLLLGWVNNDFAEVLGGKTGYTNAAGYSFAVSIRNNDGRVVDVVVLGAEEHEDRFTESRDLANMVFENYQWP